MMKTLPEKVAGFVAENNLFSAPCHILAAVSGGADSMTLLHLLMGWRAKGIRVSAVHINHGLRGAASERDEAFVREFCAQNDVPLLVYREDVAAVATDNGQTVEQAGRQVRYACFEQAFCSLGADYVATAHTADDQAETMLMRLIRGTGTDGLVGIPMSRGVIRRPLLGCRRKEIEQYCEQNKVPYCQDESNSDLRYTRNRIRHEVLPLLREMNPGVEEALLRLSSHVAQDVSYLSEAVDAVAGAQLDEQDSAPITAVAEQASAIRCRVIRGWFEQAGVSSYEETHICAVEQAVLSGHGEVCLSGGVTALVEFERITFTETAGEHLSLPMVSIADLPQTVAVGDAVWQLCVVDKDDLPNVHNLFANRVCDYDKIVGDLILRGRQVGDTMHPAGRGVGKSLKKLMNEWRVPAKERDAVPLICDEKGIVLIPGYTCDQRVRAGEDTKHFLVWRPVDEQG